MSVDVLILTHDQIGNALLSAATKTFGQLPLQAQAVPVTYDTKPEEILANVKTLLKAQAIEDGVLILTDLFGSTPYNIANCLQTNGLQINHGKLHKNVACQVVSGVNLPMLMRVFNYPNLTLADLAEKACSGGQDGVLNCGCDQC